MHHEIRANLRMSYVAKRFIRQIFGLKMLRSNKKVKLTHPLLRGRKVGNQKFAKLQMKEPGPACSVVKCGCVAIAYA